MDISKLSTKQILNKNLTNQVPDVFSKSKILLHNIRSMHNVGSAFRSSDAFGISELIISGYTPAPPRPEITKTAIGAEDYVPWKQYKTFEQARNSMQQHLLIGIEQTNVSVPLHSYIPNFNRPSCFIFGNEVTGLDEEILPYLDAVVEIPQFGHKHSLNVAVSIGVVLFGMYEKYLIYK